MKLTADDRKALQERFLRYVRIDTQSREGSDTYPSTEKQKDLLGMLVTELRELGVADASMDEYGYVTATVPANLPDGVSEDRVATVGLLAHADTYPDTSGKDVKPQIIESYDGSDIVLPGDPSQVLLVADNPNLAKVKGDTVITTDGTTLLGADDKAGIAEIMTVIDMLGRHPEIHHGRIRIGFTPDEEIGEGTKHFDVEAFGADVAYTLDGSDLGEIEDETFCADSATVTVKGLDVHPGYAKGKLVNAARIAAEYATLVAEGPVPETTEGREGYLHPHNIKGNVSEATLQLLVRDFDVEGLKRFEDRLRSIAKTLEAKHSGASIAVKIDESYRNMKYHIAKRPEAIAYAIEAIERCGITPVQHSIRGGTDGARLSELGLPTPNLFAGGQNFHSVREWVSLDWMVKSCEVTLALLNIYAEKA